MLSGTRANIAVKVFGKDLQKLRELAKQVESVMREIPGVVDLSAEQQTDTILRDFDRRPSRFGLKIAEVAAPERRFAERGHGILEGATFDLGARRRRQPRHGDRGRGDGRTGGRHYVRVQRSLKVLAESAGSWAESVSGENAKRKSCQCNVAGGTWDVVKTYGGRRRDAAPVTTWSTAGNLEEETHDGWAFLGGCGPGDWVPAHVFRSVRDAMLIMVNLPGLTAAWSASICPTELFSRIPHRFISGSASRATELLVSTSGTFNGLKAYQTS